MYTLSKETANLIPNNLSQYYIMITVRVFIGLGLRVKMEEVHHSLTVCTDEFSLCHFFPCSHIPGKVSMTEESASDKVTEAVLTAALLCGYGREGSEIR